jgi:hypothetical protein
MAGMKNAYETFVPKCDRKRPLETPKRRWDIIKNAS